MSRKHVKNEFNQKKNISNYAKWQKSCAASAAIAALQELTQKEDSLNKKKCTVALFADISGAFDTVSGDAFIEAMKEGGISKAILNRNKQYIGNRTAIF